MKIKILVIEDDKEISNMLLEFLSQNNYDVICALNGLDGIKYVLNQQYNFDLILLDLMLPYKSGDELLREIRNISNIPIIIISAKSLTQTKIELLRLGADDYITKPFDLNELLARIEANLKRYNKNIIEEKITLTYGDIILNKTTKEVFANNILINFTAKEYNLLELMIANPKKVFSKQNLYESVWNDIYAYDDNTINTHISNIRRKLKEVLGVDYIQTVWGMGYKLI